MESWNTPFFMGSIAAAVGRDVDYLICAPHPSSLMCPTDEGWLPITFDGIDGYLSMLDVQSPFVSGRLSHPSVHRIHAVGRDPTVAPRVSCDEAGGVCQAVRHLAEHGRKRIAFISRTDDSPKHLAETDMRLAGYRRGIAEAGLGTDPELVVPLLMRSEETEINPGFRTFGRRALRHLLQRQVAFDAIVCWSDDLAIGAIQQLVAVGKHVPDDVAVIGFDNLRSGRNYDPPLTTVTQPCYAIGCRAMELLISHTAGSASPLDQNVVPMHLTRRATCGCALPPREAYAGTPAGDDPELRQLAVRIFGKPQDISPERLNDLANDFAFSIRAGEPLTATVGRLMPVATGYGLDSSYAHMYLMTLRDHMRHLQDRLAGPATHDEQITVARSAAAELAGDYSQLRERIQPQVTRLMRGLIQPLARNSNDSALPDALRQCCMDTGGRFFSLVRCLEGGCYDITRWSRDGDGAFDHTTTHGLMSHRMLLSPGAGPSTALMQEMRDSEERTLGFLSLDATSAMMPAYPDFAANVGFVLEATRTHNRLRQMSDAKSRFLSSMSHEIRSPMTSILGYTDLLSDETLSSDERGAYVETIRRNGQHLLLLINDILDLSKIEAGKTTVENVTFRLDELLADIDSQVRVNASEKGLAWSIQNLSPLPPKIITDPTRLRQILLNLAGNAVKFTQSGFARLSVRFTPSPRPALTFQVTDSGIGMSSEQVQRIFEPFQQADASVSRRFGGTGLGLAISKRLVELLGGSLLATSTLDQGSTFTVELPIALPADASGRQAIPPRKDGAARQSLAGRILLAEDAPDNQALISLLLRQVGLSVELACNGAEAVAMATAADAARARYDLILMDIQMPELDGLDATRHLRAAGYTGAIVALTANALNEDRDNAIAAGCDEFLRKPIERSRFHEILTRFCSCRA